MRIGSGGVLLVGFAVLVMIITLAAYVNPATVQVHADTSSDFVDLSDTINQIARTAGYLPLKPFEKKEWIYNQTEVLNDTISEKGVQLNVIDVSVPSDNKTINVSYSVKRGTTFFYSLAHGENFAIPKPPNQSPPNGGPGGGGGGYELGPLKFYPSTVCGYYNGESWPIGLTLPPGLLIENPTSTPYENAKVKFFGSKNDWALLVLQPVALREPSLLVSFGDNASTEVYIPPARTIHLWPFGKKKVNGTVLVLGEIIRWGEGGKDYLVVYLPENKLNFLPIEWHSNFDDFYQCVISHYPPWRP